MNYTDHPFSSSAKQPVWLKKLKLCVLYIIIAMKKQHDGGLMWVGGFSLIAFLMR